MYWFMFIAFLLVAHGRSQHAEQPPSSPNDDEDLGEYEKPCGRQMRSHPFQLTVNVRNEKNTLLAICHTTDDAVEPLFTIHWRR